MFALQHERMTFFHKLTIRSFCREILLKNIQIQPRARSLSFITVNFPVLSLDFFLLKFSRKIQQLSFTSTQNYHNKSYNLKKGGSGGGSGLAIFNYLETFVKKR